MTTRLNAGAVMARGSWPFGGFGLGGETVRALAAQTTAFALLAIQQIAVVPIFVHGWGVSLYADWLVVFFAANLLRVLDLGLVFALGNNLRLAKARNDIPCYEDTIRLGQAIYFVHFLVGLLGLSLAIKYIDLQSILSVRTLSHHQFVRCIVPLAIGTLLSLWRDFYFQIYPAYGEFDRGVALFNLQLVTRIGVVALALVSGAGPVGVSIGWAAVDVFAGFTLVFVDLRRRHPWGSLFPDGMLVSRCSQHLSALKGYAPAYVADQILLNAPVLILGAVSLPQHEIVVFNIARTYSNLARQFISQYSRTFGIHVSQMLVQDVGLAAHQYLKGVRFISVISGCLVGGLIAAAPTIYRHWVPDHSLFRYDVVCVMVLGFCLVGPAQVSLALLRHTPAQRSAAVTLTLQAILSLVLGPIFASCAGALGLAVTLAAAEILCIVGPAGLRAGRMLNLPYVRFAANGFGISVACGLMVGAATRAVIGLCLSSAFVG